MKSLPCILTVAAILSAGSFSAVALPSSLDIDFRDDDWNGANGNSTFTVGDIKASAMPQRRKLYQDSTDGLGVTTLSDLIFGSADEISGRELLYIDFANGAGDGIGGVWITDLFPAPDGSTVNGERGQLKLTLVSGGGEITQQFFGADSDSDGSQFVGFGGARDLVKVVFEIPDPVFSLSELSWLDDFSVAGFSRASSSSGGSHGVPDGGLGAVLLGGAVLAMHLMKRKA